MKFPNWQRPDPDDSDRNDFFERLQSTLSPFGVSEEDIETFDDTNTFRVSFGAGPQMDITMGPGGRPIIGRDSGMMLFDRLDPTYNEHGPTPNPTVTSAWNVLGSLTKEALETAGRSDDPGRGFANSINLALGMGQLREGQGFGAQYLPTNWRTELASGAQRRLATTYAAQAVPTKAMGEVYPHYVPMSSAHGGLMPVMGFADLQAASTSGAAFGGGKRKQTGMSDYQQVGVSGQPWYDTPVGRTQIYNVAMPLGGATGPSEGQTAVAPGLRVNQRQTYTRALTGWGTDKLNQIGSLAASGAAKHGSSLDIIRNQEGESMYSWRDPHWSNVHINSVRISLPESYRETSWWQGLDDDRRGMFDFTGGTVSSGRAVPQLVVDAFKERGMAGTTSHKGLGHKGFNYQLDFEEQLSGVPEQYQGNLTAMFEAGPKEWHANMMAIGTGLGVVQEGDRLVQDGQLNEDLVSRIMDKVQSGDHLRRMERTFEVTPELAGQYEQGDIPNVIGTQRLANGNLQVTRSDMYYVGPMAAFSRMEYPMARARVNPEEMSHMMATNRELANRVLETGRRPDAHIEAMRAAWASYGVIDAPSDAIPWSDVKDKVAILSGAGLEGGDLSSILADDEDLRGKPIRFKSGLILPSARSISALSATNTEGVEVSPLVNAWEAAVQGAGQDEYLAAANEVMTKRGWLKELQSVDVAGVAGPGAGRADIPINEIVVGREQARRMAREVAGRNVSDDELNSLLGKLGEGEGVSGKITRFPQSDVYNQNDLFLKLRYDAEAGENEILMHPLVASAMRGDFDADIYRWFTTGIEHKDGEWAFNSERMPAATSGNDTLNQLIGMFEQTDPEAVAQARKDIEGREFASEAERKGYLLTKVNYWANEQAKHSASERWSGLGTDATPDDAAAYMREYLGDPSNRHDEAKVIAKQANIIESKTMMGRTYNALRRSIGERSRRIFGANSDSTRSVFGAAASGYQKALDLSTYDPMSPLGQQRMFDAQGQEQDPTYSFGLARMMEAFGSQSLLHGGGYMANVTGDYEWTEKNREWVNGDGVPTRVEKPGFRAPWHRIGKGKGDINQPSDQLRNVIGQTAMFAGEFTPQQMAAMMTGTGKIDERLVSAISGAREWVAGQEGDATSMMSSKAGQQHMLNIWKAAGLEDSRNVWQMEGAFPEALRDQMLLRTRSQVRKAELGGDEEYTENVKAQLAILEPQFEQITGKPMHVAWEEAAERQAAIDIQSGQARYMASMSSGDDLASRLIDSAYRMSESRPDIVDPKELRSRESLRTPDTHMRISVSEVGNEPGLLFSKMLMKKHRVKGDGWGGIGSRMHSAVEEEIKRRFEGDQSVIQEQLIRGNLADMFDMGDEYRNWAISGKADLAMPRGHLRQKDDGTYELVDWKTYSSLSSLEGHTEQTELYVPMMEKMHGIQISSAKYVRVPRPNEGATDEDMQNIASGVVDRYLSGDLADDDVLEVPLSGTTYEEHAERAREILEPELKRRTRYEQLLKTVSPAEAQEFAGLSYGLQIAKGNQALASAERRSSIGISADDIGRDVTIENAPQSSRRQRAQPKPVTVQDFFGVDLSSFGVENVNILSPDDYADKMRGLNRGDLADSGGFSSGNDIYIRGVSEQDRETYGGKVADSTILKRRAAHEAGHVLYRNDQGLRQRALLQVDDAIASGRLDKEKLIRSYGDQWREGGASELVAEGIASSFGQLPTYGNPSGLDIELNKIAASSDVTAGDESGDRGPLITAMASGRGGGRFDGEKFIKMFAREMMANIGTMQGAMFEGRDALSSNEGKALAFRVAGGDLGAMQSRLARTVLQKEGRDFNSVASLARYIEKGGAPSQQVSKVLQQLTGIPGGSDEMNSANTPMATASAAMRYAYSRATATGPDQMGAVRDFTAEEWQSLGASQSQSRKLASLIETGFADKKDLATAIEESGALGSGAPEGLARGLAERAGDLSAHKIAAPHLAEFDKALKNVAGRLEEHGKKIADVTQNYEHLDREQRSALKQVTADAENVLQMRDQALQMGQPGREWIKRNQGAIGGAESIIQGQQRAALSQQRQAYDVLAGGRGVGKVGRFGGAMLKRMTSGFDLMWMNRVWGMTGGAAFQAQGAAMEQEMAAYQSAMVGGGAPQVGSIAQGLLGMQARKQAAQASMGRGAYMAYGGMQSALAGNAGELAGVLAPALGVGLMAGRAGTMAASAASAAGMGGLASTLSAVPFAPLVGGAAVVYGAGNYFGNIGRDRAEVAYRYRDDASWWERQTANAGAKSQGLMPGMDPNRSYDIGRNPISGTFNNVMYWLKNTFTPGAWDKVREWEAEQARLGNNIAQGHIESISDTSNRATAIRRWAEDRVGDGSIMNTQQLMGMYGTMSSLSGQMLNTDTLPDDLMEQMFVKGVDPRQMGQIAKMFGGTKANWQQVAEQMVQHGDPQSVMGTLQSLAPLGQMGFLDMDWLQSNLSSLGGLSTRQQHTLQRLSSGDRRLLAQIGEGGAFNLGLPRSVEQRIKQSGWWGDSSLVTVEPNTGHRLHTTTGMRYDGAFGALDTAAAMYGGTRGIQFAQQDLQRDYGAWQYQQQIDAFQRRAMYTTGRQFAGLGGQVSPEFANLAQSLGGMWGIQDRQRAASFGWQMQQADASMAMIGTRSRHFHEDWNAKWDQLQVRKGWAEEEDRRKQERYDAQDDWWLYRWNYRQQRRDIQYGRNIEDLDEAIRFSTGREKRQLMKRKERLTEDYTMQAGYADKEKDYWEQQKDWRDEDFETAKSHRLQKLQWQEEDMLRNRRQHDEIAGMQMERVQAQKQHAIEMQALQDQKVELERAYWEEQQEAQAAKIEKAEEYRKEMAALQADQLKLITSAQDAVQLLINKLNEAKGAAAAIHVPEPQDWGDNVPGQYDSGSPAMTEPEPSGPLAYPGHDPTPAPEPEAPRNLPEFHTGGQVGVMATGREFDATLTEGEFVVPAGGTLIKSENPQMINLLEQILRAIERGNGRFEIMVQNPATTVDRIGGLLNAAYGE